MSSRALEAASWAEGAGASPGCSSRALIFGSAGLAGCRAVGRLRGCWYLLQIWDPLKCVRPDARLCLGPLLAAQRVCVNACPAIPWPILETGVTCGIAFNPSLAWGSRTREAGQGSKEILSHVSGVGEDNSTPMCLILPYSTLLLQKSPQQLCKQVGAVSLRQPWGGRRP